MNGSARRIMFSGLMFWLVITGVCLYFLFPLKEKLHFGIDLVGGSYLTLEVQTEKAVEAELLGLTQKLVKRLKDAKRTVPAVKDVKDQQIIFTFDSLDAAQNAAVELKNERDTALTVADKQLFIKFTDVRSKKIKADAVKTNIEVFKLRLNKLSVAEIAIAQAGERNIIIELPGVADPMQARAMIGKPAVLEFRLVERMGKSPEDIMLEYDGQIPDDMEILPGKAKGENGEKQYFLVPKYTDITGKSLAGASSKVGGQMGVQHVVEFRFTSEGGEKFYDLTSKNFGRNLAIVLDNVVITAPRINAAISTDGVIEGDFTSQEAKDLSMLLLSGALVAPVTIEGEQQIGPTLGSTAIQQGLLACALALLCLLIFCVFFYSLSGLLAFTALIFNLIFVLFGLYAMGAVLTLPGIAGLVLTVGMAVDCSVIIYEKIRDVLKTGASIRNAVNVGFSDAMEVIIDSNVTTLIVGVVLYKFGTGPVQGFAVTTVLGILATLATGLFFLKSLFIFILDNFNIQKLKI
jgi:preprotein translocase subunit SecD